MPSYGPIEPKRKIRLHFEQIHPILRIAHTFTSVLTIGERIIHDHEVVLILSGSSTIVTAGRTWTIEPGTLLFLSPFTPHTFRSVSHQLCTHIAVHFDFCQFDDLRREDDASGREPYEIVWPGGQTPPLLTTLAPGHWIEHTLREVVDLHAGDDALSRIDASCRLTRVLAQMMRWGARSDADAVVSRVNHDRIARVLAHIGANLSSTLTVDELAVIAGVSRSRFVSLFRETTGDSPQHYIQQRRVAEARRLLADPSLQIKQIAAMTGFEDRFYFSKVFRRVDGLTPTQFRAAILLGREDPLS